MSVTRSLRKGSFSSIVILALLSGSFLLPESAAAGDSCFGVRKRRGLRVAYADRMERRHDHGCQEYSLRGRKYRRQECHCVEYWRDGYYKTVCETVREPGCWERVWVPACYETRVVFGCRVSVRVGGGHYEEVYRPGRVRTVERQVWVPGCWVVETRCARHCS